MYQTQDPQRNDDGGFRLISGGADGKVKMAVSEPAGLNVIEVLSVQKQCAHKTQSEDERKGRGGSYTHAYTQSLNGVQSKWAWCGIYGTYRFALAQYLYVPRAVVRVLLNVNHGKYTSRYAVRCRPPDRAPGRPCLWHGSIDFPRYHTHVFRQRHTCYQSSSQSLLFQREPLEMPLFQCAAAGYGSRRWLHRFLSRASLSGSVCLTSGPCAYTPRHPVVVATVLRPLHLAGKCVNFAPKVWLLRSSSIWCPLSSHSHRRC